MNKVIADYFKTQPVLKAWHIFKEIVAIFVKNDGLFENIRGIFRIFTPQIKLLS